MGRPNLKINGSGTFSKPGGSQFVIKTNALNLKHCAKWVDVKK